MVPTLAIREKAMQLLAADTATLAQAADNNKLALIKASFVPDEGLTIADLDFADFDGSTPLDVGLGAQAEGLNPGTNDSVITLKAPAGGFRWETTGVTNLPQTIFGFALTNEAGDILFASGTLENQITLTDVNQVVQGLDAILTQVANSIS